MHPVNQTAREDQKPKGRNGHTIHKCLQPQFIIRKQHSRSSGRSTDQNMTTHMDDLERVCKHQVCGVAHAGEKSE